MYVVSNAFMCFKCVYVIQHVLCVATCIYVSQVYVNVFLVCLNLLPWSWQCQLQRQRQRVDERETETRLFRYISKAMHS